MKEFFVIPGQDGNYLNLTITEDDLPEEKDWYCPDCKNDDDIVKACYPLDNDVLYKGCNTRRIQALTSRISAN